jgi:UDP-N-acetyl-D-glucosamine dehydrogenase
VNENMPWHCRSLVSQALNHGKQKSLKGSEVLVLGVAYKPNIGDMRESPALKLIELLLAGGANVSYHDPHVAELTEYELSSVPLEPAKFDAIVIVTDHGGIDYEELVDSGPVIVDFRNATGERGRASANVWKL